MNTKIPFLWVILAWAGVASIYFLAAYSFLWQKTGLNMWSVWWQSNADNLKSERRFADEIRKFPCWHFGYQFVKWGTLVLALAYLTRVFFFLSQR